ncbi:glycosyltransferase family 9 protein [Alcanivorax sp. JB21]|uniref:glycosyltransferase family 9 protein n=1 Tax=Alcanivorax limicola TaxID=2874102 RepID=UPI001CBEC4A0|nr:glycosyltransferase family 9 protein [Alcanivorax limicola]MBZ2190295.1 glycosyltransferase family 9 protein [Alcanivorax limicola]
MAGSLSSVCILRLSAIGDACNAASVVQAIRQHYPLARITWVIGKVEAALLGDLPGVEFVIFDKRQGWRGYRLLRQQLRGRRFDVLLHMQLSLRANIASLCIRARRRIGFDRARSKELHSLVINERIGPRVGPHVLDGFRQFATAIDVPLAPPVWQVPVDEADRAWARAQLSDATQRHLVIAPAASSAERNWLVARYAALAEYAVSLGFAVYLCGGPADKERRLASAIAAACPAQVHDLVGRSTLKQLFALLQQASVVVAPDTGPVHMAVAAGTPVIGLYGHSSPQRTGPYHYREYVVEAYHHALATQLGKTADQVPWGQRVRGEHLMADIALEDVTAMLDRVIREQKL